MLTLNYSVIFGFVGLSLFSLEFMPKIFYANKEIGEGIGFLRVLYYDKLPFL